MKQTYRFIASILCLSALTLVLGCAGEPKSDDQTTAQGSHNHDHDDHDDGHSDETFAGILSEVEEMKDRICTAFADEKPGDAHDDLHAIGHHLEELPELAAKEGLTEEQTQAVNAAVESLFDGFGKLDDVMHGGDPVDIAEVTAGLTKAIESLEEVAHAGEEGHAEHGAHGDEHSEAHGDDHDEEHEGDHDEKDHKEEEAAK